MKNIVFCCIFCIFSYVAHAGIWPGSGSKSDPYCIGNIGQLEILSDSVNGGHNYEGSYFQLVDDIDVSDSEARSDKWVPIGDMEHPFGGHFDGGNFQIHNLRYSGGNLLGLFGHLSSSGVVCNMIIDHAEGWGNLYVGNVCGLNEGIVVGCSTNNCIISGYKIVGGVVGVNYGVIDSCFNNSYAISAVATGGIAGYNYGEIINCKNFRNFDGALCSGGIVGYNGGFSYKPCFDIGQRLALISQCENFGEVYGETYTGGISGRNEGIIANSYNAAYIRTETDGGGIAGINGNESHHVKGIICNSHNNGYIHATYSTAGGICGTNTKEGVVANVYNSGDVGAKDSLASSIMVVNQGEAYNCFRQREAYESFKPNDCQYDLEVDQKGFLMDGSNRELTNVLNAWVFQFGGNIDLQYWKYVNGELHLNDGYTTEARNVRNQYFKDIIIVLKGDGHEIILPGNMILYSIDGTWVCTNHSKADRHISDLPSGIYLLIKRE
ncbi:MAG: hypothetical protein MJZ28_03930 [Paludibacteraceae bacterium]|nr:hypothetical protein [Paludibacteraceae bacterium]